MNKVLFSVLPVLAIACGAAPGASTGSQSSELESQGVVDGGKGIDAGETDGSSEGSVDAGPPDSGTCWATSTKQMACETDFRLFKQARAACESEGGYLNVFIADEACHAGSSNGYSVTCCSTPPSCNEGGGMGGPTCEGDNKFFESAESSCKLGIAEFQVTRGMCAAGQGDGASFTCACL